MRAAIRQWFFYEDSWVIVLGLGLVGISSLLFVLSPAGLVGQIHISVPHWESLWALQTIALDRGSSFAGSFLLILLMTLMSARGMGLSIKEWSKGFSCLWVIILVCMVLGSYAPVKAWKLEGPLIALLLGFIIGNLVSVPQWIRLVMRGEFWLKLGIVLMGATLPFSAIINAGPIAIGQSLLISLVGFGACFLVGSKLFRLDYKMAAALAGGLAVGNITGVIACAEASRAKLHVLSTGFVLVVLSSVVLMFGLTWASEFLGLPGGLTGAWIGSAETADVAGFAALSAVNDDVALQAYTLVKVIGRDMGVVIWALLVAVLAVKNWTGQEGNHRAQTVSALASQVWQRFPKFILGLFGASILTALILHSLPAESSVVYKKEVLGLLKDLRGCFFTLCFLSIGMSTRWADLRTIGWRPVGAFVVSIVITTGLGYILSVYVFRDFWMTL